MTDATRIILTRARGRNQAWAAQLDRAGLRHLELPLVQYAPLPVPADLAPAQFDWIVFTSPQGVRAFAALKPELGAARCAVLGHGTARAVTEAGWPVAFNAGALDGAGFVAEFLQAGHKPGDVLLPGPKRRLTEPRASLQEAGYTVQELPLYETLPTDPAAIAAAELRGTDVLFFCSPSAVRAFAGARADKPRCVAIGRTTADACRQAGLDPAVADTPDLESMVRAAGLGSLPGPNHETVRPEKES